MLNVHIQLHKKIGHIGKNPSLSSAYAEYVQEHVQVHKKIGRVKK